MIYRLNLYTATDLQSQKIWPVKPSKTVYFTDHTVNFSGDHCASLFIRRHICAFDHFVISEKHFEGLDASRNYGSGKGWVPVCSGDSLCAGQTASQHPPNFYARRHSQKNTPEGLASAKWDRIFSALYAQGLSCDEIDCRMDAMLVS